MIRLTVLLAKQIHSHQTITWVFHLKAFHDRVVDIAAFAILESSRQQDEQTASNKVSVEIVQSRNKLCGFCLASVSSWKNCVVEGIAGIQF